MERESFTNDQVEQGIGHFLSLSAAALAATCEWIMAADRGQLFLTDGARTLPEWLSAHFGWRHATAAQLVRVARRLGICPACADSSPKARSLSIRSIRSPSWPPRTPRMR